MALASLPADVIRAIFDVIPLRPRLLVLARVCRRWRAVAYASVTEIRGPYTYAGPYDRYPNLTVCAFDGKLGVPDAWTPEQRARIASAEFELSCDDNVTTAALPSLTSLELRIKVNLRANLAGATRLMALAASSLTHIGITYSRIAYPCDKETLPPLPALRSLAVRHCVDFVQHYCLSLAPQLTRLHGLSMQHKPILPAQLGAVRDLAIDSVSGAVAADLIAALPSLTALHLHSIWGGSASLLQAAHSQILTMNLSYRDNDSPPDVTLFPSLRNLILFSPSTKLIEAVLPLSVQIRNLEVTVSEPELDKSITRFTNLTRLSLRSPDASLLEWWHLPQLTELVSGSRPLLWVTNALQRFPSLMRLRLSEIVIISSVAPADVSAFEAEVRKADRRGMELIWIESTKVSRKKICVKFDTRPLQRTLHWLTLFVGLRED